MDRPIFVWKESGEVWKRSRCGITKCPLAAARLRCQEINDQVAKAAQTKYFVRKGLRGVKALCYSSPPAELALLIFLKCWEENAMHEAGRPVSNWREVQVAVRWVLW